MSADNNKIKVLIVDDEENIRLSLSFLLRKEGYEVAVAENGAHAVDQFTLFSPEVILMDVMMPEMDGFSSARKIRELDHESKTRIVFLTAKGTMADKQEGYLAGADDYIIKPFDNVILLEKIKEAIN